MQKASLRSPFYIFLLPLLIFFFPPSPGAPKVKFKFKHSYKELHTQSYTPCLFPSQRELKMRGILTQLIPKGAPPPSLNKMTKYTGRKPLQMRVTGKGYVKHPP